MIPLKTDHYYVTHVFQKALKILKEKQVSSLDSPKKLLGPVVKLDQSVRQEPLPTPKITSVRKMVKSFTLLKNR